MSDSAGAIEVVPLGQDRYEATSGSRRRVAYATGTRTVWVFIDGRVYVVPDAEEHAARRPAIDDHALTAPMPATVLAIHAAPGRAVRRGDVLMVLEAMKMELPIRAPRDGQVKSIGCEVGELVQPGATLLELDEAPAGTGSEKIEP